MPVSFTIQEIPIGSKYVQNIGNNDRDDLNDFPMRIIADENVELEQSSLSVSSGSSIVAFRGEKSVYEVIIRPPTTAGMVTLTIASNAVSQGNAQTSKSIRVSTSFPDADAEVPTQLLSLADRQYFGIAVSPTRILINANRPGHAINGLNFYRHDGTATAEPTVPITSSQLPIQYFNGDILAQSRYSLDGTLIETYALSSRIAVTPFGFLNLPAGESGGIVRLLSWGSTSTVQLNSIPIGASTLATQGNLIYSFAQFSGKKYFALSEITAEDTVEFRTYLNINGDNLSSVRHIRDIACYRDTFYILQSDTANYTSAVYTLDIRKYRPLALNTKTTIPVQFVTAGETLDLKQFAPDAEQFIFSVGFDKPPYLSINASNELVVGTGGDVVFVKLTAINRIDSIELEFYLVILQATAPKWRDVSELTMRTGSSYDLFQLVPDAETIVFRSGRTQLVGSSLSNGIFTIGTVGGAAHFTARKGGRNSHIEIQIDVVQASDPSNFSDIFRHRVEIAGIDVTADVKEFPTVTKSLDIDTLNEYLVSEISLTLRSNNQNGFKYNSGITGNFWKTNGLNAGGFQALVKVYIESLVDGSWVSSLLFSGIILEPKASIPNAEITLVGVDISSQLERARVQNFGTLQKWDSLRQQSDEGTFERLYVPESSILPMQPETVAAWTDRTELTISRLQLPSEGRVPENTAHPTPSDLRLPSVYRGEPPVANFKTTHWSEDIRFLIQQLALTSKVYNTEIDIPDIEVETPFILNHGSIAFSVENTRTTRLPVDWVHDPSNNRILNLLSNPEGHVSDMLVQYRLNSDSYKVLHTFDKDLVVPRIARQNSTNYYIFTSKPIPQDRSAQHLPRPVDSTGYGYDAAAEGSEIKIWHYNASTNTLTEHVAEDDNFPPQLGIHYHVGFENGLYVNEFEGIRPDYRGPFKWHNGNLYYRYAKNGEFGVARVNAAGATERLLHETDLAAYNHLNFAFDVNSSGTVYFVYSVRDSNSTSLIIKRRASDGTVTTLLTEKRNIGDFLTEDTVDFGGFLGCYEALFHNNFLYVLCPIQTIDNVEDRKSPVATPIGAVINSGTGQGRLQSTVTVTNSPLDLGEDIVVRFNVRNASRPGSALSVNIDQSEFTITNGTLISKTRFSSSITLTIRPANESLHQNIGIGITLRFNNQPTLSDGYILIDFGIALSRSKSAGMALYRCNVNAQNPSLTLIETYDFVTRGACNLTIHDGAVHFMEHTPSATKFKPINPDLDGYWTDADRQQTMGYNMLPELLGALKKINSSGEVESLGNLWYEERPYNIVATRCLSFDGDLHVVMGYGNPDELLRHNSLASQADNFQHLVYGRKLRYILPSFAPNGSVYEALADLAHKVNATLSIQDNIISVQDRSHYRAMTDGATGTGTGNLDFDGQNKTFPSSGYLLIDKEIISFTGITGNAFTGITRGVLGTAISSHANDTSVLYLDKVLSQDRVAGNFSELQDTNRIYNIIRDPENNFEERDPSSINTFGERPYTLNLGLTRHETAWQKQAFAEYLAGLKDPHLLMNLTLRPSFYLELGDIVGLRYADLIYAMRIMSITYSKNATTIRGRVI